MAEWSVREPGRSAGHELLPVGRQEGRSDQHHVGNGVANNKTFTQLLVLSP